MSQKGDSKIKKILIVGDSGRGKTTFATALSQKLKINHYSTDDFFWIVKFTQIADRATSLKNISQIYNQPSWIVEGATRSLIREGIEKSDQIFNLIFPNFISQFWTLLKRKLSRKEETWRNFFNLCKHQFVKKYQIGEQKNKESLDEMLKPFSSKTIKLYSFRQINNYLKKL